MSIVGKHLVSWMRLLDALSIFGIFAEDSPAPTVDVIVAVSGKIVAETSSLGLWVEIAACTHPDGMPVLSQPLGRVHAVRWELLSNVTLLDAPPTPEQLMGFRVRQP